MLPVLHALPALHALLPMPAQPCLPSLPYLFAVDASSHMLVHALAKREADKLGFEICDGQTLINNATREKLGNERANIFVANRVFK